MAEIHYIQRCCPRWGGQRTGAQRAQYPLSEEYTLNHIMLKPPKIKVHSFIQGYWALWVPGSYGGCGGFFHRADDPGGRGEASFRRAIRRVVATCGLGVKGLGLRV